MAIIHIVSASVLTQLLSNRSGDVPGSHVYRDWIQRPLRKASTPGSSNSVKSSDEGSLHQFCRAHRCPKAPNPQSQPFSQIPDLVRRSLAELIDPLGELNLLLTSAPQPWAPRPGWELSAPQDVPSHDTIGHAKLNTPLPSRIIIRGRVSSQ